MRRLIDGDWHADVSNLTTDDVDLEETRFDAEIEESGPHPPDPERYHLHVSWACPWTHGTLLTRALLGLEDAISISVVDPHRRDDGWECTSGKGGCTPDHLHGADYLHEGDTALLGLELQLRAGDATAGEQPRSPVVVTDDKPLRRACKALSVPVSGSIGLLIRAVERGDLGPDEARDVLYAMDEGGARLSASLVRRAERLIEDAAEDASRR